MARGRNTPPACMTKYGFPLFCASFPLFCASWASLRISQGKLKEDDNNEEEKNKREDYLILGGGGGGGQTGVKNALALPHYDLESDVLSESVHNFYTDDDPPYRMAVHPVEESIICSFSNGCRGFKLNRLDESAVENVQIILSYGPLNQLENVGQQRPIVFNINETLLAAGGEDRHLRAFEWPTLEIVLDQHQAHNSIRDLDFRGFNLNSVDESAVENVRIMPFHRSLNQLENVGLQRSLVFSINGTLLAAGGEDGHLRVFKWPTLEIVLDQHQAHNSIRNLDFSPDEAYLASLGDSGPCQIWILSTSASEATLSVDEGESLGFCRFSRDGSKPLLFMTVKKGDKGLVTIWDMKTWEKVGTHAFEKNPISAFNISSDGKFLAIGTREGDISIIEVSKMHPYQKVKEAHLIFVTSIEFSRDSRLLVSVSGDSSARVTRIEDQKQKGGSLHFLLITIILTIILAFFIGKNTGL